MSLEELCESLQNTIINSYGEGLTLDESEKFAAKLLHAQMQVSSELQSVDLDARMRKNGLKAVKAAVYTEAISKLDKKPTEAQLEHMINMNKLVSDEQDAYDVAEAKKANLERYFNIFKDAHVYYRQLAKGRFE